MSSSLATSTDSNKESRKPIIALNAGVGYPHFESSLVDHFINLKFIRETILSRTLMTETIPFLVCKEYIDLYRMVGKMTFLKTAQFDLAPPSFNANESDSANVLPPPPQTPAKAAIPPQTPSKGKTRGAQLKRAEAYLAGPPPGEKEPPFFGEQLAKKIDNLFDQIGDKNKFTGGSQKGKYQVDGKTAEDKGEEELLNELCCSLPEKVQRELAVKVLQALEKYKTDLGTVMGVLVDGKTVSQGFVTQMKAKLGDSEYATIVSNHEVAKFLETLLAIVRPNPLGADMLFLNFCQYQWHSDKMSLDQYLIKTEEQVSEIQDLNDRDIQVWDSLHVAAVIRQISKDPTMQSFCERLLENQKDGQMSKLPSTFAELRQEIQSHLENKKWVHSHDRAQGAKSMIGATAMLAGALGAAQCGYCLGKFQESNKKDYKYKNYKTHSSENCYHLKALSGDLETAATRKGAIDTLGNKKDSSTNGVGGNKKAGGGVSNKGHNKTKKAKQSTAVTDGAGSS